MIRSTEPQCQWVSQLFHEERHQFGSGCNVAVECLDGLAAKCHRRIRSRQPADVLKIVLSVLFREERFRFGYGNAAECFSLTSTLLNKRGNCLGLTTLLVGLGSRFDLPLKPLLLEGHVCACLIEAHERVVVETSRGGALLTERLAKRLHGESSGRLLSDEELLAVHLSNRAAFVLIPHGEKVEALRKLDQALELFPDYVGGRINRTTLLVQMGQVEEAAAELERVFRLEPGPRYQRVAKNLLGQLIAHAVPSHPEFTTVHW